MHFKIINIIPLLLLVQCSLQHESLIDHDGHNYVKNEPYEVGLRVKLKNSTILCGGSLIKPTFVLTSRHCFPEDEDSIVSVRIYIGTRLLHQKDPGKVLSKPKRLIFLKKPDGKGHIDEVAIIELRKKVILSDKVALVKLSTIADTHFLAGKIATALGSDSINETDTSKQHLTRVKFRIGIFNHTENINITDPTRIEGVTETKPGSHVLPLLLGSALVLRSLNIQVGVTEITNPQIHYRSNIHDGRYRSVFTNVGSFSELISKAILI